MNKNIDYRKILIIDDEIPIRQSFVDYLEDCGFIAFAVQSGKSGLEILEAERPDLVLTDLRMPEMDGLEFMMKAKTLVPDLPVIVISGVNLIDDVVEALRLGAWDYLIKPIKDMSILSHAVNKALERSRLLYENRAYQEHLEKLVEKRTYELRRSEEEYREFVEGTDNLITRIDSKTRLLYANHIAEKIFGIPVKEFLGKSCFDFIHPEDRERTHQWFNDCESKKLKSSSIENRQVNVITKEVHYFLWRCNFHYSEEGRLLGVNGIAHNITDLKLAEMEKERLKVQLYHAQKMESIGQLAGGVAHDFNNMLEVILGYSELAIEQLGQEHSLFSDLQEIYKAAKHSANLTRQLLAFARKQNIMPKILVLNEVLDGMLRMLRRLIGEDIKLAWLPGESLWSVKIDPSQVDQILANLCVNARDAISGIGQISISTKNVHFDKEYCASHAKIPAGEYVLLKVEDNGCGMNKETQDRLFEPFFTTKELGKGTGLGLSTVYGIVKQNNGFIHVDSFPGQGTAFCIYFSRHTDQGKELPKKMVGELSRGHETVLLVEDEPAILNMIQIMLERQGYTVLSASKPHDAIYIAQKYTGQIHLLISDVIMPEMNGRDLAQNILALYPDIKSLFISGYTAEIIARRGILDKGSILLQKPLSMQELIVKVIEILK